MPEYEGFILWIYSQSLKGKEKKKQNMCMGKPQSTGSEQWASSPVWQTHQRLESIPLWWQSCLNHTPHRQSKSVNKNICTHISSWKTVFSDIVILVILITFILLLLFMVFLSYQGGNVDFERQQHLEVFYKLKLSSTRKSKAAKEQTNVPHGPDVYWNNLEAD